LSKQKGQSNCNVVESGTARESAAAARIGVEGEGAGTERRSLTGRMKGYLCVASAALCWGISASLGRAVFTGRLKIAGQTVGFIPPLMLTQSRTTFSFLILIVVLLCVRGRRGVSMGPREILKCAALGIFGIAASNFFYYFAIEKTTVATAIILEYVAPVLVLLYMLGRGRQRATAARIWGVALAVIGSMLAIGIVAGTAVFPWFAVGTHRLKFHGLGVLSALLSAVAFAFWNIYGGILVETADRWLVALWAMFGAAMGWILVNPPAKIIAAHYQPRQWLFLLVFAVFSSLVPFSLYLWGLEHLDPTRAIVTSCLEPVFAIVIAAIALGETVTAIQTLGIVVTLTATILVQIPERAKGSTTPESLE
jgi:drug/metabolite transporter (DMT)-like permease